jgi:hypothetical protein
MPDNAQLLVEWFKEISTAIEQIVKSGVDSQLKADRDVRPKESTAVSDAQGASNEHNMGLDRNYLYRRGRIVDSFAYLNCYKVQLDSGSPTTVCFHFGQSAFGPMGTQQITTLPPGVYVWVVQHPLYPSVGGIIGVEPPFSTDPTKSLSDLIGMGMTCGWKGDDAHSFPLQQEKQGGIVNYASDRPLDGTTLDWGYMSETGMRFFLDPFMFQAAVDETTGIFGFFIDSLLRVAGHNLEIRSSGSELGAYNDQGEFSLIQGYTPYFWEQLGILKIGTEGHREYTPEEIQVKGEKEYNTFEPKYDDQQPFHRSRQIHGYLGQGGKRQILIPPTDTEILQYGSEVDFFGALSEDIALTGLYTLRSAKGISLVKRPVIPTPKQVKVPAHKDGDSFANYRFAGREGYGLGDEHKVTDRVTVPEDESVSLVQAAGVTGLHSYIHNWELNHPFVYHKEDWDMPSEQDLQQDSVLMPQFSKLSTQQYCDDPESFDLEVDHRYGDVRYYKNESYLSLLDDGGVVLGDGFGAEIRMTGGSVFITAPGDVWTKAGRNVNSWAGFDSITRARNSIDITASDKDVRIKSEKNMQILAGNSGEGGLLLESRGANHEYNFDGCGEDVKSCGVMIRSLSCPVVTWAPDIYLRTGSDGGPIASGNIILDTKGEEGAGAIRTSSDTFEMWLGTGLYNYFPPAGEFSGEPEVVHEFQRGRTMIGSDLGVDGYATIDGDLYMDGNVFVAGGHISTQLSNQYNGLIGDLTFKGGHRDVLRHIQLVVTDSTDETKESAKEIYKGEFKDRWYADNRPGNKEVIEKAMASLRTPTQYKTEEFSLFEDRWQALARLSGHQNVWREKMVMCGTEPTFPYPGAEGEKLRGDLKFAGSELGDITGAEGGTKIQSAPLSNTEVYENPEFTVTSEELGEKYTVI